MNEKKLEIKKNLLYQQVDTCLDDNDKIKILSVTSVFESFGKKVIVIKQQWAPSFAEDMKASIGKNECYVTLSLDDIRKISKLLLEECKSS